MHNSTFGESKARLNDYISVTITVIMKSYPSLALLLSYLITSRLYVNRLDVICEQYFPTKKHYISTANQRTCASIS